uniref:Uncharacterized protein n=1 Tax=Anopheles minimus TaxID=112268 RepID=A0A182W2S0_9DIPT
MNGLVEVVVLATVLVAGLLTQTVYGETNIFEHAEPSQHVMHIRKLSDSDKLRIELEPVWFHLESTEQRSPSDSQQVKRQTDLRRPFQVYSNREEFARDQQRRDSRSGHSTNDNADAYLREFWHLDRPNRLSSREITKTSTSAEQQLENTYLPSCFRAYLQEMYDRNSESVRKLMRCLAERSDESCPVDSQEDGYHPKDKRVRRKPKRKVVRKRKYDDDAAQAESTDERLTFEQLFIRSDSDVGGHIFEPLNESNASESDGSEDSSSTGEAQRSNADGESRDAESHESGERLYTRDGRLRPVAYRRLPQKYNTRSRQQSDESEESKQGSGDESEESYEHY